MKRTPTQDSIYTCLFSTNCHCEYSAYCSYLPNGLIFTVPKHSEFRAVKGCCGSCHFPFVMHSHECWYKTLLPVWAFRLSEVSPNLALRLMAPFGHEPGRGPAFRDQRNTQRCLGHMSSQASGLTEVKAQWANPSEVLCHVSFHFPFALLLIFFSPAHNPNICQAMLACLHRAESVFVQCL